MLVNIELVETAPKVSIVIGKVHIAALRLMAKVFTIALVVLFIKEILKKDIPESFEIIGLLILLLQKTIPRVAAKESNIPASPTQ